MAKNKQTFTIDANLDISQFLSNYKKMIETMKKQGGDQNALASMEKTFDNLAKRANTLEAASKQTFSNSKEIERYQQKVEGLKKDILTAGTAMQTFASNSANFDSKELENAQKELQKIIKQINDVKKTQQTQVASGLNDLGFKNAKDLAKQIDSQEELNKALEKEYDIRSQTKRNLQQERNAKIASINQKYVDSSVVKTSDFKAGTDKAGNADALNTDIQIMMSLGANTQQIMEQLEDDHEDILEDLKQQIDLEQRLNVLLQERDALVESTKTDYDNRINAVEDAQFRLGNKSSGHFEASDEARRAFQGVDFASDASTIQNLQGQATNRRTEINNITQQSQGQEEQLRRTTQAVEENNRAVEDSIDIYSDAVDETHEMTERQEELNASFDNMKDAVKTLLSVGTAISSIKDVITQTYEDIKELDKSFAEIAMVTDYSVEEMWSSYDKYAEMANELGQSTQSVIQASGLFYQQGLQTNEALELTEDTMKLATLAGLDFEKATSQMTAALRGFHMEMDQGNVVTDVYSELAAKAAADVEGIAYAMSKTASIASSAGMEFETTSAFLTQMIETTQEAAENIGTAMKTIIARFTELKENVAGTEESEFEDLSYNKVDEALQSVGVSIKDATGQFRDLDDVFLELSEKWNTLDRNSQRYIATIAAGSRQQSRFIAMMENYDRTMELVDTAYNSAGKSSEQFAKYQDTVEYKVTKLKNTWEQMRIGFADSSFFKGAIDNFNILLEKISKLDGFDIAKFGILFLTLGKIAIQNLIKGIQQSANGIQTGLQTIFTKMHNFFAKKIFKINMDDSKIKADLKKIQEKIEVLKQVKITFISDNQDPLNDLKQIEAELKKLKISANDIKFVSGKHAAYVDSNSGQTKLLRDSNNNVISKDRFDNATAAGKKLNDIDKNIDRSQTEERRKQQIQETKTKQQQTMSQLGQSAGMAFSMAATAAITSYTMRENPGEVFGDTIKSGLMMMIPSIISLVGTMSAGMIAASGGIMLLVTGLVAGAGALAKWTKNQNEQKQAILENSSTVIRAKKNIEALTKAQEDLDQAVNDATAKLSEQEARYELLSKNEEKITEYSNALALTTEEEEDYLNISNEIAESFPQLIDYYDEQGNAILKMGQAWEDAKKEQLAYYADAKKEQGKAQIASDLNELSLLEQQQAKNKGTQENLKKYTDRLNKIASTENLEYAYTTDLAYEWDKDDKEYQYVNSLENARREGIGFNFFAQEANWEASLKNIMLGYRDNLEGDPDDAVEAKEIADLISTIMTEEGYSSFEGLSEEEVFNNFINAIDNDTETAKEYQKALKDGITALEKQGDASGKLTAQHEELEKQINESIKENLLSGDLTSNENYANASKNVQNIIQSSLVKDQSLDIESLREKYKDDENSTYSTYYKDGGNWELRSSDDDALVKANEAFIEWMTNTEEYQKILTDTVGKYDENTQKLIDDYYTQIEGLNTKERVEKIQKLGISEDVQEDMIVAEEENIEAYNKSIEDLAKLLGANFEQKEGELFGKVTTPGLEMIDGFSEEFRNALENTISQLPKDGSVRESFQKSFQSLMSDLNLSEDEMTALFSIDWSQVNAINVDDFKEKISDVYKESTGEMFPKDKLDKEFEKVQQWAKTNGVIEIDFTLAEGAYEGIEKELEKLGDESELLLKGLKESFEDEFLSFETIVKLKEQFGEFFDDITKVNDKGLLVMDQKGMDKYFTEAINQQILNNNEIYQEKKARLEAYEAILNNIDATATQVEVQKELNRLIKTGATDSDIKKLLMNTPDLFDMTGSQLKARYDLEKKELEDFKKQYELTEQEINAVAQSFSKGRTEIIEKETEEEQKKKDDLTKATEDLTKAQKEYNEALHGTEKWLDEQDPFATLSESASLLEKKLDSLKKKMEDITTPLEGKDVLSAITQNRSSQLENLTAQQRIAQDQLNQLQDFYKNSDYSKYFSEMPDGTTAFDLSKWFNEGGSDEMGDWLLDMASKGTEAAEKLLDTQQKINDIYDEQEKEHEERVKNYATLQEKIIDVLKEQAKEEIDTQKEKYEALKEEDDNYLDALKDAIDKQRQLRDQESQYQDLATKEKKLSLMQRDTSGANQKEVQELEKEIEEERQNLLDSKVDEILDDLSKTYELQAEMRDLEIEQKEIALEEKNYLAELASVESGFHNQEDVVAWMIENDKEWENYTIEQQEQKIIEWEELGTNWAAYLAEKETGYSDLLTTNEENIKAYAQTASDAVAGSIERIKTNEELAQKEREIAADKAKAEAQKDYDEALKKYNDFTQAIADATPDKNGNKNNNGTNNNSNDTDNNSNDIQKNIMIIYLQLLAQLIKVL